MGAVTYPLLQMARTRGWCKFVEADPRGFHASLLNMGSSHPVLPECGTVSPYYQLSPQVGAPVACGDYVKDNVKDNVREAMQLFILECRI